MRAFHRLLGFAAVLQTSGPARATKPHKDHSGIVRRESASEGDAVSSLVVAPAGANSSGVAAFVQRQVREERSGGGGARRGIGDDHVISNYGRHLTVLRKVSEKTSCQGACDTDWSDTTLTQVGTGLSSLQVHGMFYGTAGSDTTVSKTIAQLDTHKMARVSFVYWSLGKWSSGEKGTLVIDGTEVWAKTREDSTSCTGWTECGETFSSFPQGLSCCQLVSRSFNHNETDIQIQIGSNIGNENYSFAFSNLVLDLLTD